MEVERAGGRGEGSDMMRGISEVGGREKVGVLLTCDNYMIM